MLTEINFIGGQSVTVMSEAREVSDALGAAGGRLVDFAGTDGQRVWVNAATVTHLTEQRPGPSRGLAGRQRSASWPG